MAVLLPKKDWRDSKPSIVNSIAHSNPLTEGMKVFTFSGGSPRLLNTNQEISIYGGQDVHALATHTEIAHVNGNMISTDPSLVFSSDKYTLNWVARVETFGDYYGCMFSFDFGSGLWFKLARGRYEEANNLKITFGGVITTVSTSEYSHGELADRTEKNFSFIRDGDNGYLYENGVLKTTVTHTGASSVSGTSPTLRFSKSEGAGVGIVGDLTLFSITPDVAWDEGTVARWASDPYQILGTQRNYWPIPEAAAPTGFEPAWARNTNRLYGAGF